MKKLIMLGMLALGLSIAAPQAHSQVNVRVHTHSRFMRPRAGLSINLGGPVYTQPAPSYASPSYGSTVIVNRHDSWRGNDFRRDDWRDNDIRRQQWHHRYARMNRER